MVSVVTILIFCIVNNMIHGQSIGGQLINSIKVQCNEHGIESVTYVGEAESIHGLNSEADCTSNPPVGLLFHTIDNVYKKGCEMQKSAVISNDDPVFKVSCVYGNTANTGSSEEIDIVSLSNDDIFLHDQLQANYTAMCATTTRFSYLGFEVPPTLENKMLIKVADDGQGEVILRLQTNVSRNVIGLKPMITDCIVASSTSPWSFLWKFISEGCGDGTIVDSSLKFRKTQPNTYELPVKGRHILSEVGEVNFTCKVAYCSRTDDCLLNCPRTTDSFKIPDLFIPLYVAESQPIVFEKIDITDIRDTAIDVKTTIQTTTSATATVPETEIQTTPLLKTTDDQSADKNVILIIVLACLSAVLLFVLVIIIAILIRYRNLKNKSFNVDTILPQISSLGGHEWGHSRFWETGSIGNVGMEEKPSTSFVQERRPDIHTRL